MAVLSVVFGGGNSGNFFVFLTFLPELDDTLFGLLSTLFFFGVVSGDAYGVGVWMCRRGRSLYLFLFPLVYLLSHSFPGSTLGLKYYHFIIRRREKS